MNKVVILYLKVNKILCEDELLVQLQFFYLYEMRK